MRPIYLEFCGINSFSEKAVISFDRLLRSGVFGIFGDTGSGKSTILDAVNFALYGSIERIGRRNNSQFINYNCDSASVAFEFEMEEAARVRYRVERSIRKKTGLQKAQLFEREGEGFRGVCDGVESVNEKLEEIIGLKQEDFRRCIALPQGEFAQFIKSTPSDRMRLIARLFDLEEKGQPLSQEVNRRFNLVKDDYRQTEGKLGEYADISIETVEAAARESRRLAERESQLAQEARQAELAFLSVQDAYAKRKKLDALEERLRASEKALPVWEEKRAALPGLERAEQLRQGTAEAEQREQALNKAQAEREKCADLLRKEEESLSRLSQAQAQNGLEEQLSRSERKLAQAQLLLKDVKLLRSLRVKRSQLREQYKLYRQGYEASAQACEKEISRLERELSAYGGGDTLYDYLKENFKDAVLAEEYAAFCADLRDLAHRHPELDEELEPLLHKYSAAQAAPFDFGAANAAFRKKDELRSALERQRAKQSTLATQKERCDEIGNNGKEVAQQIEEIEENLKHVFPGGNAEEALEEITRENAALKQKKKEEESALSAAQARVSELKSRLSAWEAKLQVLNGELKNVRDRQAALLAQSGWASVAEAQAFALRYGAAEPLRRETDAFFAAYARDKEARKELDLPEVRAVTEEAYCGAQDLFNRKKAEQSETGKQLAAQDAVLATMRQRLEKKQAYEGEFLRLKKQFELLEKLKKLLDGNKFMEFVAVEYLKEISAQASKLLLGLTNGRYFLEYQENFFVGDNLNSGILRSANTLSGGETFLVSLSLALALSSVIYRKSLKPIEFFFLDEGFGTLDEKLLDTVMDTLERLKNAKFSIGIITHVEELKHRIESKLLVTGATEEHGSRVRMIE